MIDFARKSIINSLYIDRTYVLEIIGKYRNRKGELKMKLLIELPDGYVGVVMRNQRIDGSAMDKLLRQAVIDGTPLDEAVIKNVTTDRSI